MVIYDGFQENSFDCTCWWNSSLFFPPRLKPWGNGATFLCAHFCFSFSEIVVRCLKCSLCEKFPNTEFFLVPIQSQCRKYRPKKLRIWTLFTQWLALKALTLRLLDGDDNQKTSSKEAWKHCLRPWLGKRQLFRCYYLLFQEIKRDTKAFKELIRIEENQFEYLVEALTQKNLKKDAKWENASNYMKWSA